jgi:hypothetical protein
VIEYVVMMVIMEKGAVDDNVVENFVELSGRHQQDCYSCFVVVWKLVL